MSRFRRVQQWCVFSRQWYLYDAKFQDPFDSAKRIARYLRGGHKPTFDTEQDVGDHVVVMNAGLVAMPGDEWRWRMYYHHTNYAGGKHWEPAWKLHRMDPTVVLYKAIYKELHDAKHEIHLLELRTSRIARLHLFHDENIPKEISENISDQIRQLRPVPKRITDFTQQELDAFPKVFDYPDDYAIK